MGVALQKPLMGIRGHGPDARLCHDPEHTRGSWEVDMPGQTPGWWTAVLGKPCVGWGPWLACSHGLHSAKDGHHWPV